MQKLEHSNIPEFGARELGQRYDARPGSYALIFNFDGCIAVLETPRGCYLPGGGSEGFETPEETLIREVREECGFSVSIIRRLGAAVEYVHTTGNAFGIRKECVFFAATVVEVNGTGVNGTPLEEDHTLEWLRPQEAKTRLAHGSQRWSVSQSLLEDH